MISGLYNLYKEGGVDEVSRGVRDYTFHSSLAPLISNLYSSRTMEMNGVRIEFVINDEESLRRSIGHGEKPVIADFLANISPGDTVWDVGANQGTYSLFAAKAGADVHAFEPGSQACRIIRRNADVNDVSVVIHKFALGSANERMVLREADRSGVRWVAKEGPGDNIEVRRGDDLDVPVPDVLKIDVEGAEMAVLEGMEETLERCRRCYVEVHSDSADDVRNALHRAGFETDFVPSQGQRMVRGVRTE